VKYSILGFNQEKIVSYSMDDLKCDVTDLLLLNYIIYAQSNPKMKHILDDEKQPCVWLQHKHILEDLPILNITEGTLKNRLTKLRKMELITSKTVANQNAQGTNTYYRTTSFLHDMFYETTSFKNDVVEEPRHSKMTSNTQVNKDTKVNKNNSKELLQNSPTFEFGKSKPKRESLFTKCVNLVDEFIDKHNCGNPVRQKLLSYLNYRLSVKEKPLYVNMWKGMLVKLDKLHQEGYGYEPVIDYCLERGYLSFYPPTGCYSDVKEKPWEKGVKSYTYTEEEKEELEKREQEMIARGERVWF